MLNSAKYDSAFEIFELLVNSQKSSKVLKMADDEYTGVLCLADNGFTGRQVGSVHT